MKHRHKVFLIRPQSFLEQENRHPRSCCVPWTLKYIHSILRSRQESTYFYDLKTKGRTETEALRLIKEYKPEYIVIQSNSLEYPSCKYIFQKIKEVTSAKVIIVGQLATYGNVKISEADYWLRGESEEAVAAFITNGRPFDSKHVYLVDDLDNLPFPHYDNGTLKDYYYPYPIKVSKKIVWGSILTSRGCPYECIFCTQILRESYGKKIRLRSPANVIDEIEYLMRSGANVVSFEDDSFTASHFHVNSICDKLLSNGIKVKWVCQARVDELDFETLEKMKRGGCELIRFGIESGCARIVDMLQKTNDAYGWIEKTKEVFSWTKKLGIFTDAMFIIGSPGETEIEILENIKFAKLIDPDLLQVCFFTPYPGSLAYELYKDKIKNVDETNLYHYGGMTTNLSCVESQRLLQLHKKFYRSVVFRPKFLTRHFFNYLPFYVLNFENVCKITDIRNFFNLDHVYV